MDPTEIARREAAASGELNLSSRSLVRLPDAVLSDERLWGCVVSCNIRDNALTTLPPALASFRSMERLQVDKNQLEALHPAMARMALTEIHASRNRLTCHGINRCP